MIYLQNINITYGKSLIEDGTIFIPDNKVVTISGKSGTGKTSILYRIGLVSDSDDYNYLLDGEKVDLSDKENVSKIQQNCFGILFQDGSMIDNLTVEENIVFASRTGGVTISKEEICELLELVELPEEKLGLYPQKLSGGERQRASLAMILAKKTKYIIADEPTASLDSENADRIVQIFKKLKEQGYTIIISTHSKELLEASDVVYFIENKKILCKKGENDKQEVRKAALMLKDNISAGTVSWYARHSKKKGRVINGLLMLFCALAISGFAVTNNIISYLTQTQKALLLRLSDREIYAVNQNSSANNLILDCDGNLLLEDEVLDQIKGMDGVDRVYEMMEWRSFALSNNEICAGSAIQVKTEISDYIVNYSLENSERDYFVALPYFEEQQFENQLYVQYGEEVEQGVYLSYELAEELGILDESLEGVTLELEVGLPVYKMICNYAEGVENDMDIVEFTSFCIKINGILNENVTNRYTINGNSVIYMPYNYMKEYMDNFTVTEDYSAYQGELVEWSPSAIVVFADSYKNVDILVQKIEKTTSNMITRYDYQDTESLEKLMQNLKEATNIVLGIVLFIIFVLMCALYISDTISRKREYAILKANGFSGSALGRITVIESIFQAGKILIVSLVVSCLVTTVLSVLLLGQSKLITLETIVYVILFSVTFVTIPSLMSIWYIATLKVEKIIRN